MGAREDVLSAAQELTARGRSPFSPAEVIREARRQGSTYSDATLRTHIVSAMCVNAPSHHASQYRDLERVGRGQYVLTASGATPGVGIDPRARSPRKRPREAAGPGSVPASGQATRDWYWEGNVQAALVAHLSQGGWRILRVADTARGEQGHDIHAQRADERLLVEVKGYPSSVYVRGPKQGQPKPTQPALQARQYFSHALLSGMLMRGEAPTARVALAFPDFATYRNLAERTTGPLQDARVELWLVDPSGDVLVISP